MLHPTHELEPPANPERFKTRKRLGLRIWRIGHSAAAIVIVVGTVVHAWLVQGAMEDVTKAALCLLVLGAGVLALRRRRVWRVFR